MLLASVVLSFVCTLGISILFIRFVVGDAGFDSSIPTFAFIFLVALGIDYTIFLMARVREEARQLRHPRGHAARDRRHRAGDHQRRDHPRRHLLGADDAAGDFTFDLGFMVALGILLDTFIVRTIMVPAAVELIGDKIWWPSTAARRWGACTRRPASRRCRSRRRPASGPSRPACASRRRR